MFFHGYPSRPLPQASSVTFSSLSPIFREQFLRARGVQVNSARCLNQILIRAANDDSQPTDTSTSVIAFPSKKLCAIVGETFVAPAERDCLPSTAAGLGSTANCSIYSRPDCTYAVLQELQQESGWRTPILDKESLESVSHPAQPALGTAGPALSLVQPASLVARARLAIPINIPTGTSTKPSLPLDDDAEFIVDIDAPTSSAVVQGTNAESEDINDFVVIAREAENTFSEQPRVMDDEYDWIEVDAQSN